MDLNENFWRKQNVIYEIQPFDHRIKYECWQPGRWAANRSAVLNLKKYISSIDSACELGAGSAAFSFELYRQLGINITGIDMCAAAKDYAARIASDMGIPIVYQVEDLFDSNVKSDLILSLGVVEHFDKTNQIRFIEKCREMSNKYVLVAIPNQESPIFQNYVKWANGDSQKYEEDHQPLTTNMLIELFESAEMRVVQTDGFQIFLSELKFWNEIDLNKIPLYMELKERVIKYGNKWLGFPYISFEYDDIPFMVETEASLSVSDRLMNAFMTYVLAEKV